MVVLRTNLVKATPFPLSRMPNLDADAEREGEGDDDEEVRENHHEDLTAS